MRLLKPEFSDLKLCALCGAPAARLGEPYANDRGEPAFWDAPVDIPCSERTPGALERKRVIGEGRAAHTATYHIRRYTHVCLRTAGHDAAGGPTDDKGLEYACGALSERHLRRVTVAELPESCFYAEVPR